uniref:SWIM-type domain-containing protein n=1 Tax=Lactuca sativa TaxID=4236 RepID=A0A9R1XVI2_LACSA|nr:hypothetical protein LSAT_V11C200091720 [Lactuca sativa]
MAHGHPTLFTIKLYHGGEFTKYPDVRYIDGTVNYVDMVDIDEFLVHELDAIMKGFRYGVPPVIYYHFLVPGGDFHFGLRPLGNDQDVANFSQYVSENKVMKVYTEHGETRLLTYFLNPKPVTKVTLVQLDEPHEDVQQIDEAPDDQSKETPVMTTPTDNLVDVVPTQANQPEIQVNEIVQVASLSPGYNRRKGMSKDGVMASCSKKIYFDDICETEQIAKDFVEATTDFDIGLYQQILQSNVDGVNGTDMHDVNEPQMDEENQSQMDEENQARMDEENQPQMNDFWDFDYQTDAFVQDGSENQPQSNMDNSGKENVSEVESKERSETEQEDDSDDSDYWVDEDNVIEDVEVDIRDFNMSIDTEVEFLDKRARNPRQHESDEEADELDVIDNDAFHSMDEDSDQDRKRRAVLKQLSKEKSCSLGEVESNPTIPVKALQEQLQKKYGVGFSIHKVFRAKAYAKIIVVGDYKKQYEVLRDYILELQSTNPDTTVKLELGDVSESNLVNCTSRCFKRIYVCLGGMKKGFKACLRDFLGLDGAHMKGPYPGLILNAVGLDSNNGIYPLAYAIIEIENCESWKWFLECLGDDLDLHAMSNFTFVSDRQKGLLQAVSQLFPCAKHRFCLRHIHENMKKQWRTKEYKDHLRDCATATTVTEFNHFMHQFSLYDKSAYEWLKSIPPQHWAKSHFTGYAMSSRCNKKRVGPLTPTATKIMEKNEAAATQYIAEWCGDEKYQVKGPWNDQHVVDMHERVCICRKWELIGIPCRHVISVLYNKADHGEGVHELHTYVHKVHWLQTWKTAYGYKVEPIKGRALWPRSECPMQITPPLHRNQPGRPKRKRRQSMEEKSQSKSQSQSQRSDVGPSEIHGHGPHGSGKLTRKFVSVACSKCGNKGHNSRTCKGQGGT